MEERPKASVALIINDQGFVLAVSRKDDHADLGLPGGKVDPGETPEEAMAREVLEETGLVVVSQRLLYVREDGPYDAYVYHALCAPGEIHSQENAVIEWVDFKRLIEPCHTFADFNRELFQRLGAID